MLVTRAATVIEDLNQSWSIGESAYDVLSNSVFTLKAMLLWTISDFPAYRNLAGCKVKGKMGCPVCGKHTDSVWMKFCRKHVYMSHRKGLPPPHRYRSKKSWFDGHTEHGNKCRILSGQDISSNLKNFVNNFGNVKESGAKRKRTVSVEEDCDMGDDSSESEAEEEDEVDEEELSGWKKRSIFFQLLYWEVSLLLNTLLSLCTE